MAGITVPDKDFALLEAVAERNAAFLHWAAVRESSDDPEAALQTYHEASLRLQAVCPHELGFEARGYGVGVCRRCGIAEDDVLAMNREAM